MSRLVIVSNRVADFNSSTQSGGLVVGLGDALRARGGVWFGWDGRKLDCAEQPASVEDIGNVRRISVPLTTRDYSEYYLGFANSVLWPLFHYRLDLVDYRPDWFSGYCRVNARFAAQLAPFLQPDDTVWIQDYHLIPLAHHLRALGCRQRIGFFLHIPLPPADLLATLPDHRYLAEALLAHDVIGFQTSGDLANFQRYIEQHGGAKLREDGSIRWGDRLVTAGRFPIGIDVDAFRAMAQNSADEVQIDAMRREILGRKQIIGVDRLDYSKGLPARMEAYRRLLEQAPELAKHVTLLQIAPPTREDVSAYCDIRAELESLAGAINGQFADFDWSPVRYIHRNVPRDRLASLFRASEVGLVTPLRDGMNLVAKEYVAAQDDADPGVLVLSQFAGAAEEMREALLVNPYDVEDMAKMLHRALTMPKEERRRRHEALLSRIRTHDAEGWLTGFLAVLEDRVDTRLPDAISAGSLRASAA